MDVPGQIKAPNKNNSSNEEDEEGYRNVKPTSARTIFTTFATEDGPFSKHTDCAAQHNNCHCHCSNRQCCYSKQHCTCSTSSSKRQNTCPKNQMCHSHNRHMTHGNQRIHQGKKC